MDLECIKSQKKENQLLHESYLYTRDRRTDDKTYYKCAEYGKYKCKGRAITEGNQVVCTSGCHNHVISVARIEAKEVLENIKEASETAIDAPAQIIST